MDALDERSVRTVLKSLLGASTDARTAEVVAGRVAFALEMMCKDDASDATVPDEKIADGEAAWTPVPPVETECEKLRPQPSRVEELATPKPKTARVQSRPSSGGGGGGGAATAPRTAVRSAKGSSRRSSASPPPFVGMVSSASAAAAASSAGSARRSRTKQLRLFPEPTPAKASTASPGHYDSRLLKERSLETRQQRRVRGNAAQNFAATTMAACFRGYAVRRDASRRRSAIVLQRGWRTCRVTRKLARLRDAAAHRRKAMELAEARQLAEAESVAVRRRVELESARRTQMAKENLARQSAAFSTS